MAKRFEKSKAIQLRLLGKSYSEIKKTLGVSKASLSVWLRDYPLSKERIRELRDKNPRRIENFRDTMQRKREERLRTAYQEISKKLGSLSERELFIAGLFLYWGEGGKTMSSNVSLSNTDPAMLRFFVRWLGIFGIKSTQMKVVVHLYADMDERATLLFWSQQLDIPLENFRKPQIKKSKMEEISYKRGFGKGTCNVHYGSAPFSNLVLMGVKHLQDNFK